jgi:hypothetical protein
MQEIINAIAQDAGMNVQTATLIVGTILAFIQKEAPQDVVARILAAFPDAGTVIAQSQTATANTGGLGGLVGRIGAALGGKAGDAMTLVSQLLATGVTMTQLETAGTTLIKGVREEAGPKVVTDLLKHVPELQKLAPAA